MTHQREVEQKFKVIIDTVLSSRDINAEVLQAHIKEYATLAGVPYSLAKQAVILKVQDALYKNLAKI